MTLKLNKWHYFFLLYFGNLMRSFYDIITNFEARIEIQDEKDIEIFLSVLNINFGIAISFWGNVSFKFEGYHKEHTRQI